LTYRTDKFGADLSQRQHLLTNRWSIFDQPNIPCSIIPPIISKKLI